MYLKGLKNMKIEWFDGTHDVLNGRIYSYPEELARMMLRSNIAAIPTSSDFVEEVKAWSHSVSPKLSGRTILDVVKSSFGVDLFVKDVVPPYIRQHLQEGDSR